MRVRARLCANIEACPLELRSSRQPRWSSEASFFWTARLRVFDAYGHSNLLQAIDELAQRPIPREKVFAFEPCPELPNRHADKFVHIVDDSHVHDREADPSLPTSAAEHQAASAGEFSPLASIRSCRLYSAFVRGSARR